LDVLRLVIRQTERGENLDAELIERARAIVDRYDRAAMRGHEAPGVIVPSRLAPTKGRLPEPTPQEVAGRAMASAETGF